MGEEKTSATSSVNVGDLLSGTVEHIAPYGAFIRLESGQKAMVHISELSHNFVKKVEDVLTVAEKVTAKVIKIDEKGRIDLSIKALQVREPQRPVKREEDFEKKLTTFLKASDEKIADLNNKTKDPRASKKRAPKK
ncbi:MAG: S1 RNA-binding domain-containing protein [Synergistaceae bacterium]|nr:S1 RNA-binding domain-containing protein [Synergistaceae bacterium]MBP9627597.1 S1 RNA-binding domain-containing protein [Synergistaceae bacterium]